MYSSGTHVLMLEESKRMTLFYSFSGHWGCENISRMNQTVLYSSGTPGNQRIPPGAGEKGNQLKKKKRVMLVTSHESLCFEQNP